MSAGDPTALLHSGQGSTQSSGLVPRLVAVSDSLYDPAKVESEVILSAAHWELALRNEKG